MSQKIVLATKSPYRIQAFKFLGINFIADGAEINEYFDGRPEDPKKLVQLLAKMKASAVATKYKQGIVIGFDSVGLFEGEVLEKPKSRREAFLRLQKLSGKTHYFYTGLYLKNLSNNKSISNLVETKVQLRKISDDEINKYLDQDKNYTTYALGYDPLEHYSSSFILSITGSYNNITRGMPLEKIIELLLKVGFKFN